MQYAIMRQTNAMTGSSKLCESEESGHLVQSPRLTAVEVAPRAKKMKPEGVVFCGIRRYPDI